MADSITESLEAVDPNASVHAPPPAVGVSSRVSLDKPSTSGSPPPAATLAASVPTSARRQLWPPPLPPALPLLVTSVVLFAAAIGLLVLIALDPSGGTTHHRSRVSSSTAPGGGLTAPAAIGGYQQVSAPAAVRTGLVAMFDKAPDPIRSKVTPLVANTATIAAYSSSSQDSIVLEAYRTVSIPAGSSPVQELSELYLGAGKKFTTFTFKKTDIVRCGTTTFAAKPADLCLWQDPRTVGAVIGAATPATLAPLTEAARVALEK